MKANNWYLTLPIATIITLIGLGAASAALTEPSSSTPQQVFDDPAVDAVRTKYLGGAALIGYVRDAKQHVVAVVTYRHFAPTLVQGSASLDPWADARLAIDQFAAKLAAACRDLPASESLRSRNRARTT